MRSRILKIGGLFLLALVIYIALFSVDQWLRTHKGGWKVTFSESAKGVPRLLINQPALQIKDLEILFQGEKLPSEFESITVVFDQPELKAPFGDLFYEDLTYLPGVLTFNFFGHEVEFLPRTLTVNRTEHSWKTTKQLRLEPESKILEQNASPRFKQEGLF